MKEHLYSLRDSKRRIGQLVCLNNEVTVTDILCYVSEDKLGQVARLVHERDKLGAILCTDFIDSDERRKHQYIIVNVSKIMVEATSKLVVSRRNGFDVINPIHIEEEDLIVGHYVTSLRFDTLRRFARAK